MGVQLGSVAKPIKRNSASSEHVSHIEIRLDKNLRLP